MLDRASRSSGSRTALEDMSRTLRRTWSGDGSERIETSTFQLSVLLRVLLRVLLHLQSQNVFQNQYVVSGFLWTGILYLFPYSASIFRKRDVY